jgi:hypothetical protein
MILEIDCTCAEYLIADRNLAILMGLFDELWMRMFDRMFADHYSGHVRDNLEILVGFWIKFHRSLS